LRLLPEESNISSGRQKTQLMFLETEDYKEKSPYYTKSDLKSIGWTDGAITAFLGEPDSTSRNPYSKQASPVKLFAKERVNQTMQSEPFIAWQSKTGSRRRKASDAMKGLMAEKRDALVNQATKRLRVDWLGNKTVKMLVEAAMNYWVERKKEYLESLDKNFDWSSAPTWDSDPDFLERITLNYVRHECTNYDVLLPKLEGQVGRQVAYESLRNKVSNKVKAKFGNLREEIELLKALEAAPLAKSSLSV
jgi:hypothetical protein